MVEKQVRKKKTAKKKSAVKKPGKKTATGKLKSKHAKPKAKKVSPKKAASKKASAKKNIPNEFIRPLEHLNGKKPPAPEWFTNALAKKPETGSVKVEGTKICYSVWGKRGLPGVLLIHGGRAHRRWWDPFAPMLASDQFRVATIDLSGLGDSGWRERYSLKCHAMEIFAICEAAGLSDVSRPLIVGHSFGGWATLGAVETAGEKLGGAIVIDSPFGVPDPDEGYSFKMGRDVKQKPVSNKVYATKEEPISRFRLLPSQPGEEYYLLDYIARNGLKRAIDPVSGKTGWTWKFDPSHGQNFDIHFDRDLFLAARCPLAFIYGEKSAFVSGDGFIHTKRQAKGRSPIMMIPEGHHHLMMDQPLAFVAALRALLTSWPVRVGF